MASFWVFGSGEKWQELCPWKAGLCSAREVWGCLHLILTTTLAIANPLLHIPNSERLRNLQNTIPFSPNQQLFLCYHTISVTIQTCCFIWALLPMLSPIALLLFATQLLEGLPMCCLSSPPSLSQTTSVRPLPSSILSMSSMTPSFPCRFLILFYLTYQQYLTEQITPSLVHFFNLVSRKISCFSSYLSGYSFLISYANSSFSLVL